MIIKPNILKLFKKRKTYNDIIDPNTILLIPSPMVCRDLVLNDLENIYPIMSL